MFPQQRKRYPSFQRYTEDRSRTSGFPSQIHHAPSAWAVAAHRHYRCNFVAGGHRAHRIAASRPSDLTREKDNAVRISQAKSRDYVGVALGDLGVLQAL